MVFIHYTIGHERSISIIRKKVTLEKQAQQVVAETKIEHHEHEQLSFIRHALTPFMEPVAQMCITFVQNSDSPTQTHPWMWYF